jgi:carotenoid cleavage dioxygenase-like enzyme
MLASLQVPRVAERTVEWLLRQRLYRPSRPQDGVNPFLADVFGPVQSETTETRLSVTGQLPRELNGLYARIGPNPLAPPNQGRYHWFIGDGMVHGLRLSEGVPLWYRSRWVGSDSVNRALGRPLLPGKRRGISDVVNTNVYGHAGRIWASTEAGVMPVQLDGELNSLRHGLFDSDSTVPYSAHPHLDPLTGDLHAICYHAMSPWGVRYVRINAAGQLDKLVNIPVKHGPMIHDCAITRSQVIVLDLPVTFSWAMAASGSVFPYAWNDKHPARVGLLPREGQASDIRWLDVDPCYVFHPCNAYDLPDGSVVLDVVAHHRMFDRSAQGPELDGQPRFERWTLPAAGSRVQRQLISEHPQEFPRLDERRVAQPYRYAYAVDAQFDQPHGKPLLRHDLHTGLTTQHDFGPQRSPGEMVFVPRHAHSAEDDGWLIGFVHNHDTQRSEFHVLNANDVSGPPQAVVQLPVRVPMGFHGNWVAA